MEVSTHPLAEETDLMGRAPCCEKMGLKKGPWTPEEDQILVSYVRSFGHGNWRALPKLAGLLRCGKSCRLRWMNYLRPDIKRGNFSREEEETVIKLHRVLGNRWSAIAAKLPGRTDNEIKNVWHTHLKKRLVGDTSVEGSSSARRRCKRAEEGTTAATMAGGLDESSFSQQSCASFEGLEKESETGIEHDSITLSESDCVEVSNVVLSKDDNGDDKTHCSSDVELPYDDFWMQALSVKDEFLSAESGREFKSLLPSTWVPESNVEMGRGLSGDEEWDFWCNFLAKLGEVPEMLEL